MFEIKSKIERDLMTYFFLNTSAKHHLHELARILSANPANLNKKLEKLEKAGVFKSEKRGNQRIYELNHKFPLFNEYKSIVNKTYGVEDMLKKALQKVPGIKSAYIFGSYVKGKFDEFSDIDILVIGNQNGLDLTGAIISVEKKIDREINSVEYSSKDYNKRCKTDPFIQNATKNVIKII